MFPPRAFAAAGPGPDRGNHRTFSVGPVVDRLTEYPGEGEVFGKIDVTLPTQEDHAVGIEGGPQILGGIFRQGLCEIDA